MADQLRKETMAEPMSPGFFDDEEYPIMSVDEKPDSCPVCSSKRIADILYGLPAFSIIEEELKRGELTIGGCLIHPGNPEWQCADCGLRFKAPGPNAQSLD